ncbi:MAG: NifU family protein [Bacteroidetes bacterium]|jgi:Fe-S cluster biogenesis protein NfuA|nr:NifU family protein [Bacteroidota bacterium]
MSTQINIVETSDKSILKFEAKDFLVKHNSFEFNNIEEAKDSALAQQLFHLPFVKTVYIAQNFVAVQKYNIVEWEDVQQELAEQIENYINSGQTIVEETPQDQKKIPVTVYAESTPNPHVMKFVANKKLVLQPLEFKSIDDTAEVELAQKLFHFPFVKEVYMDDNFISVQKYDMAEWDDITMELREFIRSYLEKNAELVKSSKSKNIQSTGNSSTQTHTATENLQGISKQISEILEEYVKPAVASDGGNIVFQSYDEDSQAVHVILQGACSGCPSSTMTLKNGIENLLKDMLPQKVNEVVAING